MHPAPARVQVMPLFCASFVTVAVKLCVPFGACTFAEAGPTPTVMAVAAVTVIAVDADFVLSATEVAVSDTLAGDGTTAGAV